MASVFSSSAVDRGVELLSDQTKHYKIVICCFPDKYTILMSKCLLARNRDKLSEWNDISK